MGRNTKIEWATHTFNSWWGCTPVAPECANCYAERMSICYGYKVWGTNTRRLFGDTHWKAPINWNKKLEGTGRKERVFCGSMCDIFEDNDALIHERLKLFILIQRTLNLHWLLLTKRPENIQHMMPSDYFLERNRHIWLGTTAGCQESADTMIPHLINVYPAPAVSFLSVEPLIGPLDLAPYLPFLDWVIVGGETGHKDKIRPMHPDWVRKIKEDCQKFDVPFFFKQWGNYVTSDILEFNLGNAVSVTREGETQPYAKDRPDFAVAMCHYSDKRKIPRIFDGVEWSEFPHGYN